MMTRDEFEALCGYVYGPGWRSNMLAGVLGVGERAVRYWRSGERAIPEEVKDKLVAIASETFRARRKIETSKFSALAASMTSEDVCTLLAKVLLE